MQPADFAETYSRTSVPRPVLSMWVRSVKSSRIRLEFGISLADFEVEAIIHTRHQPAAASYLGVIAGSFNDKGQEAGDCLVGHRNTPSGNLSNGLKSLSRDCTH